MTNVVADAITAHTQLSHNGHIAPAVVRVFSAGGSTHDRP